MCKIFGNLIMNEYLIQQKIYDRLSRSQIAANLDDVEITALALLQDRMIESMNLKNTSIALEV